jgi:DNA polymerase I
MTPAAFAALESRFAEVWALDFEFRAPAGCNPEVVCLAAEDLMSGRRLRLWADELTDQPPFRTDAEALFLTFFGSAEMGAFLALGWPLPRYLLDIFVELRRLGNGVTRGASLLEAARRFGLTSMAAEEKGAFRDRILQGPPFSAEERAAILAYCADDVSLTGRSQPDCGRR